MKPAQPKPSTGLLDEVARAAGLQRVPEAGRSAWADRRWPGCSFRVVARAAWLERVVESAGVDATEALGESMAGRRGGIALVGIHLEETLGVRDIAPEVVTLAVDGTWIAD